MVRLISPPRNALLLLGSSQDCVPGTNVWYNSLPYSSAAIVSFELIATLLSSLVRRPPNPQSSQWVQPFASPVACPSAKPGGLLRALSAWHNFRNPGKSCGIESNPAAASMLLRCTTAPPDAPVGSANHFPWYIPKSRLASYQPPYFCPRYSARSVRSSSWLGYWKWSSLVAMMMSGPAPTLAATAALGRISSKFSLSTRTSTPVSSVKRRVLAMNKSSSPWTNRFHRSNRRLAPFSGCHFASAGCAGPDRRSDPATPSAVVDCRKRRLL